MTPEEQAQFDALKKENSDLKTEIAELKKAQKKDNVKAKLSAAGFKTNAQGDFIGVSAPMMTALLSANEADADAMIADLKLSQAQAQTKPPLPVALTQDTPPAAGEMKLSAAQADKPTLGGYPII